MGVSLARNSHGDRKVAPRPPIAAQPTLQASAPFHDRSRYCVAMAARPLRKTYFWILPVAVLGSSSTNRILRGTLK